MTKTIKEMNNVSCVLVDSKDIIIKDTQTALDFIMSIQYETNCNRIALNKEAFDESFFILSTVVAGEILQKFITYKVKLAIVGDFSKYTSKPLKDFMYESNNGKDIFFVSTQDEALKSLTDA